MKETNKQEFIKFDFTKRDILDSFEFYLENHNVKDKTYEEIVYDFLHYIKEDIIEAYDDDNARKQCKGYIKKVVFNNKFLYYE